MSYSDFDKYTIKTNPRTQNALILIGSELYFTGPEFNFLVVGHTDNKGTAHYNKRLSKHRAETVAKWLTDHAYVKAARLKTDGMGFDEPIESMILRRGGQRTVALKLSDYVRNCGSRGERAYSPWHNTHGPNQFG